MPCNTHRYQKRGNCLHYSSCKLSHAPTNCTEKCTHIPAGKRVVNKTSELGKCKPEKMSWRITLSSTKEKLSVAERDRIECANTNSIKRSKLLSRNGRATTRPDYLEVDSDDIVRSLANLFQTVKITQREGCCAEVFLISTQRCWPCFLLKKGCF